MLYTNVGPRILSVHNVRIVADLDLRDSVSIGQYDDGAVAGPSSTFRVSATITSAWLENILKKNDKGKIVTNFFEKMNYLDQEHRKYLAHLIVDNYLARKQYFPATEMQRLSHLIAEKFTNEVPVSLMLC